MKRALGLICAALIGVASGAAGHELWLEPSAYQVEAGAPLVADIRVGENMEGPAYSFLPRDFRRFDLVQGGKARAVKGRLGDRPALQTRGSTDGLVTVVYVTKDQLLTYTDFDKFAKFARHKDFEGALAEHEARGLSKDRFGERYVRYAKSLIAVGTGAGRDSKVGLETEIVALANPYTDDVSAGMPVQVLDKGRPRANAQVELFAKAPSGKVTVTLHRTNGQGIAVLPVRPGRSYLADAVVLRPLQPRGDAGAVWLSLWASLTFAVPAAQ